MSEADDKPLVLAQACEIFGVPRRTLTGAVQRGALPGEKIGTQWTVKAPDVQRWLRYGKHKPGPVKGSRNAMT